MTTVRRVPVTATATEPGAALLRGYVDAMNDIVRSMWHADHFRRDAQEMLGTMQPDDYQVVVRLAAVDDDADELRSPVRCAATRS